MNQIWHVMRWMCSTHLAPQEILALVVPRHLPQIWAR